MGYAARLRAAQRAQAAPPRLIFGLTRAQKIASFKLSYAMAMVDSLKREEAEQNGKGSALYAKLDNLEEHVGRLLDEYRLERFHRTDLDKASALFDVLDAKIGEMYP